MITRTTKDGLEHAAHACRTIGFITLGLGVLVLLLSVWCEFVTRMQVFAELEKYISDAAQLAAMKTQFGHSRLKVIGLRCVLGVILITLGTAIIHDHKWYKGILGYCSCAIAFLTAGLLGVPILAALLLPFLYFKNKMRHNQSAHTTA